MERKVRGEADGLLSYLTFTQVHLVKICFVSAESQTSPENEPGDDGKGSRPDIPKEEAGRNGQAQSGPH